MKIFVPILMSMKTVHFWEFSLLFFEKDFFSYEMPDEDTVGCASKWALLKALRTRAASVRDQTRYPSDRDETSRTSSTAEVHKSRGETGPSPLLGDAGIDGPHASARIDHA